MTAQQHLLVQCHLFTLGFLFKVLSQVCRLGKKRKKWKHNQLGQFELKFQLNTYITSHKTWPADFCFFTKCPPVASPEPGHSGTGGSNQLAYYKLPGRFREACLVPEGDQAEAIALPPHCSPPPSQHPLASSIHLQVGAATRKHSCEASGHELPQARPAARGFALRLNGYLS